VYQAYFLRTLSLAIGGIKIRLNKVNRFISFSEDPTPIFPGK
jgi:hypothetical protein